MPAGHERAGKTMTLEELKAEPLVLMQEGAAIRQMIDDELRELGLRLRDLNVKLELGLQESARAAVLGGLGATFISRIAIEDDLAAGNARDRPRRGARAGAGRPARPRERPRRDARGAGIRRIRARAALVIVRWGLESLPEACAEAGSRRRCSSRARAGSRCGCPSSRQRAGRRCRRIASARPLRLHAARTACSPSAAGARSISGRRSPPRPGFRSSPSRRRTPERSGRATSACAIPSGGCAAAAAARTRSRSSTSPS